MATNMEEIDVQVDDEIITVLMPEGTPNSEAQAFAEERAKDPLDEAAGINRPTGQINVPKSGSFSSASVPTDFPQTKLMEALGLNADDAPAKARFQAALGLMGQDGIRVALERHFDKPVEVSEDSVAGIIFRPQGETKFRPFNRGDITLGDFAAAAPEIAQTAPEVGTAILTFAVTGGGAHSIPAALAAESAMAYATEVTRLNMGQSRGQPVSDSQIHQAALVRAGITAGAGTVGTFLFGVFQRITGRQLPRDIERVHLQLRSAKQEEDFTNQIVESRRLEDEFNGLQSGTKAQLSLGEASGDLGIIGGENAAVRTAEGAPLKELDARNNTAVQKALDDSFGAKVTPSTDDVLAGEAVRDIAIQEIEGERATVAGLTQEGRESASVADRAAFGTALDADTAASEARPLMVSAMNALEAPLKTERDALVAQGGNIKIPLHRTRGVGLALTREVKQSKFPSLQKEAMNLIEEARDAGVKVQSVYRLNSQGKYTNIKKEPATLQEVMNDLSNINEALRRGDLTPKQRRVLARVGAALRLDMRAGLRKQDPELLTEILRNNAEFRNLKLQYERGVIGRILKLRPEKEGGGGFLVADERVIPNILSNPGNARTVASILQKSGNAGPRALNTVRSGVLDWVSETPGRFNQKLEAIQEILSERQFNAIKNAKNKKEAVDALIAQEKETLAQINKTTDLALTKMDPQNMVGQLLEPGKFPAFKRSRDLLKRDAPERLAEFDGAVKRFVLKQLSPDGAPPTPATINRILDPPQGQNIQAHLKEVFGSDYLRRLRIIRNFQSRRRGTLTQEQGQSTIHDLAAIFNEGTALRGLFRFTRVAAPPLSVRGRAFTAVIGVGKENSRRALVNAFVDPAKLAALEQLGRTNFRSKFVAQQLAVLGLGHIDDIRMLVNEIAPGSVTEDK